MWASVSPLALATIPSRMVTADTEPVSVASRVPWFAEHKPDFRPSWVVEEGNAILAWLSFSSFYGRPAYAKTAELSIYVHEDHRNRGLGSYLLPPRDGGGAGRHGRSSGQRPARARRGAGRSRRCRGHRRPHRAVARSEHRRGHCRSPAAETASAYRDYLDATRFPRTARGRRPRVDRDLGDLRGCVRRPVSRPELPGRPAIGGTLRRRLRAAHGAQRLRGRRREHGPPLCASRGRRARPIAGTPESVADQILAFRDEVGEFGTLLYTGHDWADPALAKRSMELMANEVWPRVYSEGDPCA